MIEPAEPDETDPDETAPPPDPAVAIQVVTHRDSYGRATEVVTVTSLEAATHWDDRLWNPPTTSH